MRDLFHLIGIITVIYLFLTFVVDTIEFQSIWNDNLTPDLKEIKAEIKKQGILFPDVVLAQVIHETNWLKSNVYKDHNNLFGMTCHKWSPLCQCGSNNRSDPNGDGTYCHYTNWRKSIKNYAQWQIRTLNKSVQLGAPIPKNG